MKRFADRTEAGQRLAEVLGRFRDRDVVVLGLPGGGVPVAYQVAAALGAPLDVLVVRKLGVPLQPELAFGAIGEGGRARAQRRCAAARRREPAGHGGGRGGAAGRTATARRPVPRRTAGPGPPRRTALIVDDGFATGATARAAALVARARGAGTVVLAAPIGSPDALASLAAVADEVVCLNATRDFMAVGQRYDDFRQTSDEQVCALLEAARSNQRDG
jgi:predicted phosphoribosyltransferase